MGRQKLPDRRLHYPGVVSWETGSLVVGFGPDRDGAVREIFPCDGKEGSDRQTDTTASFMMASWLLQSGMRAAELLAKLLGAAGETGIATPPLIARALEMAVDIEKRFGDEIRANYAHEERTRALRRSMAARERMEGAHA